MDKSQKEKISIEVHNQIIGWTVNCDTKASIVLAFIGVLVSITFTSEYLLGAIETQLNNIIICWKNFLSIMMFISLIGFVYFMGSCCYHAIESLKANIKCEEDSIIFFGKIAQKTKEDYIEKMNSMNEEDFEKDKLSQMHNCAIICNNKFNHYNKSIKHLSIGLLFFVCFIVFVILLNTL